MGGERFVLVRVDKRGVELAEAVGEEGDLRFELNDPVQEFTVNDIDVGGTRRMPSDDDGEEEDERGSTSGDGKREQKRSRGRKNRKARFRKRGVRNFCKIRVMGEERQTDFRSCRNLALRSPDRCSSLSVSLCFCSSFAAAAMVNALVKRRSQMMSTA